MKPFICSIIAVVISAASLMPAAASPDIVSRQRKENSVWTDTAQFNALDYLLQRPAPARSFAHKRFGDHFFITMEGGPLWTHRPGSLVRQAGTSAQAGLTAGDWFTPVHGLRLGVTAGWTHTGDNRRIAFGSGAVDYLMNFSSLVAGENPNRRFEAIGVAGIEGLLSRHSGSYTLSAGARIGLQLRLNFSPSTFVYVEPRFGIYTDNVDRMTTWQRYDWRAMLMVGFGYRLVAPSLRHPGSGSWLDDSFRQNMFYGLGVGATATANKGIKSTPGRFAGPGGQIFIGKMFSPSSGLRLNLQAGVPGRMSQREGNRRKFYGLVDLDYVLNLNSAVNGYDSDRRVELEFMAGPVLAFPSAHGARPYAGFGAGLQGIVNVTDNWGLYIEPFGRLFGKRFAWEDGRSVNGLLSLNVGVRYRVGDYRSLKGNVNSNANREDWLAADRYFMMFAAGMNSLGYGRDVTRIRRSPSASFFVGRWFSPESAWRLGANYDFRGRYNPRTMNLGLSADYMLSLSSLSAGWNDDRVFDLSVFAGADGGVAYYRQKNHAYFGFHAGLHGEFNVSPSVGLFLEPQIGFKYFDNYGGRPTVPQVRLLAGISYKLGHKRGARPRRGERDVMADNSYVSFSAGPGLFSETILSEKRRRVTGAFDLSVGHWFTRASGLQGGVSLDILPVPKYPTGRVATVHVDYMLDFIQAMMPDPSRRFGMIGHVGAGFSFGSRAKSGLGFSTQAGLKLNWRVTPRLDLFLDPSIVLWQPRMMMVGRNIHHFCGDGRLMVGAAWRF